MRSMPQRGTLAEICRAGESKASWRKRVTDAGNGRAGTVRTMKATALENPPHNLESRAAAGELVKRLAHLTALLGAAVANRDQDVLNAQEKHQALITQIAVEIEAGKERLAAWADENRKVEFGDEQSVEFPNGWLRFRVGQRTLDLLSGWTWEKVLAKLKSFRVTSQWRAYVRTKQEVNKQALLADTKDSGTGPKLPPALLREVGVKIVREERFEVECKPEMAVADVPCP